MTMTKTIRALGLFSGGLDSTLAAAVLRAQGIDVTLVTFVTPFFGATRARESAAHLGLPLREVDLTDKFLPLIYDPPHGFGRGAPLNARERPQPPHRAKLACSAMKKSRLSSPQSKRPRPPAWPSRVPSPPIPCSGAPPGGVRRHRLRMYHDQGLIPLKLLHFMDGVNVTLGLPIIRTSVDHGTAYNLAGKGSASPDSLKAAIKMAAEMAGSKIWGKGRDRPTAPTPSPKPPSPTPIRGKIRPEKMGQMFLTD